MRTPIWLKVEEYKKHTNAALTWLLGAAKSATKLADLLVRDIVQIAQKARSSGVELPEEVKISFQTAIVGREDVTGFWYARVKNPDDGHAFFNTVLQKALNILTAPPEAELAVPAEGITPNLNRFSVLGQVGEQPVEAASHQGDQANNNSDTKTPSPACETVNAKDLIDDTRFVAYAAFAMIHDTRERVMGEWTKYSKGKTDLMSAAVCTEACFEILHDFLRDLSPPGATSRLESMEAMQAVVVFDQLFGELYDPENCSHEARVHMAVDYVSAELSDLICAPGLNTWRLLQKDRRSVSRFILPEEDVQYMRKVHRKFFELANAALGAWKDKENRNPQRWDKLSNDLVVSSPWESVPRTVVMVQICLEIHHLPAIFERTKKDMERLCQIIQHYPIEPARKKWMAVKDLIPEEQKMLALNPILAGLTCFQIIGVGAYSRLVREPWPWYITPTAHVYHYWKMAYGGERWDQMEEVLKMTESSIFMSSPPKHTSACVNHLLLVHGVKASELYGRDKVPTPDDVLLDIATRRSRRRWFERLEMSQRKRLNELLSKFNSSLDTLDEDLASRKPNKDVIWGVIEPGYRAMQSQLEHKAGTRRELAPFPLLRRLAMNVDEHHIVFKDKSSVVRAVRDANGSISRKQNLTWLEIYDKLVPVIKEEMPKLIFDFYVFSRDCVCLLNNLNQNNKSVHTEIKDLSHEELHASGLQALMTPAGRASIPPSFEFLIARRQSHQGDVVARWKDNCRFFRMTLEDPEP